MGEIPDISQRRQLGALRAAQLKNELDTFHAKHDAYMKLNELRLNKTAVDVQEAQARLQMAQFEVANLETDKAAEQLRADKQGLLVDAQIASSRAQQQRDEAARLPHDEERELSRREREAKISADQQRGRPTSSAPSTITFALRNTLINEAGKRAEAELMEELVGFGPNAGWFDGKKEKDDEWFKWKASAKGRAAIRERTKELYNERIQSLGGAGSTSGGGGWGTKI